MSSCFRRQELMFVRALLTGLMGCVVLLAADENVNIEAAVHRNAQRMMAEGQQTFRDETFGDEAFWGDALKLHQAIAGAQQGGVGSGESGYSPDGRVETRRRCAS